MHYLIALGLISALIAFAFGRRAAQAFVGTVLLTCGLAFAYVMWRIISGTI